MKPTRQQIEEDIKRLVKEHVPFEHSVELSDRIIEDLGFDSLDVIELVCDLEEFYDICIEDADIPKYNTVEEWVNCVETLMNNA